jgi:hypothetical protein
MDTPDRLDAIMLTPEELAERDRQDAAIYAYLRDKWKAVKCPIDGSTAWTHGHVLEMPAYDRTIRPSIAVLPMFPVCCDSCGYTVFFNALQAGIVPSVISKALRQSDQRSGEPEEKGR